MKKLEKIKQERIIKKQTKEYIESLNPMSKKQKFTEFMNTIYKHKFFYLILIPAIVLLIIFAYRPMYGIVIAFKNFSPRKGIMGSPWVGLENFERIFDLDMFWQAFKNTIVINLLKLIFGFPLSILLAIMINAVKNKIFKNTVQTLVYLPHFVSWVVVAGIIFALFDERSGSLYKLLSGVVELNIFGDGKQFVTMLVVSDIWKEVGWGANIYLAALSGVSEDLYEASELDGANKIVEIINKAGE